VEAGKHHFVVSGRGEKQRSIVYNKYYPEQWPKERWIVDARMMQKAGINVVRMGEGKISRLMFG
jgi:beta-galactosidase GanA